MRRRPTGAEGGDGAAGANWGDPALGSQHRRRRQPLYFPSGERKALVADGWPEASISRSTLTSTFKRSSSASGIRAMVFSGF